MVDTRAGSGGHIELMNIASLWTAQQRPRFGVECIYETSGWVPSPLIWFFCDSLIVMVRRETAPEALRLYSRVIESTLMVLVLLSSVPVTRTLRPANFSDVCWSLSV